MIPKCHRKSHLLDIKTISKIPGNISKSIQFTLHYSFNPATFFSLQNPVYLFLSSTHCLSANLQTRPSADVIDTSLYASCPSETFRCHAISNYVNKFLALFQGSSDHFDHLTFVFCLGYIHGVNHDVF